MHKQDTVKDGTKQNINLLIQEKPQFFHFLLKKNLTLDKQKPHS